jgi:hypothetical protein
MAPVVVRPNSIPVTCEDVEASGIKVLPLYYFPGNIQSLGVGCMSVAACTEWCASMLSKSGVSSLGLISVNYLLLIK